jgi:hypothetical protein
MVISLRAQLLRLVHKVIVFHKSDGSSTAVMLRSRHAAARKENDSSAESLVESDPQPAASGQRHDDAISLSSGTSSDATTMMNPILSVSPAASPAAVSHSATACSRCSRDVGQGTQQGRTDTVAHDLARKRKDDESSNASVSKSDPTRLESSFKDGRTKDENIAPDVSAQQGPKRDADSTTSNSSIGPKSY